jgi:hypothetical protein
VPGQQPESHLEGQRFGLLEAHHGTLGVAACQANPAGDEVDQRGEVCHGVLVGA